MMGRALMGYKWIPIGSTGPDDDDIGGRERERERETFKLRGKN